MIIGRSNGSVGTSNLEVVRVLFLLLKRCHTLFEILDFCGKVVDELCRLPL
jgi:hypothetical protein